MIRSRLVSESAAEPPEDAIERAQDVRVGDRVAARPLMEILDGAGARAIS